MGFALAAILFDTKKFFSVFLAVGKNGKEA